MHKGHSSYLAPPGHHSSPGRDLETFQTTDDPLALLNASLNAQGSIQPWSHALSPLSTVPMTDEVSFQSLSSHQHLRSPSWARALCWELGQRDDTMG